MQTRKQGARQELESLKAHLKGDIAHENGVQVLNIDKSIGKGKVKCISFDDGLIAIEFDVVLHKDLNVLLNEQRGSMIYFLYCLEGNCLHKFNSTETITKLEELQTAVVSNDKDLSSKLLIKKDERLILNLIRMDKVNYVEKFKKDVEGFDVKTIQLLDSFDNNRGYFHLGNINLEIGELIKKLEKEKYEDDLSSQMQFEGICHLILAKQISQFNFEMKYGQTEATNLLNRELEQIMEINDFIKNYPEFQHSITNLCSKSGLSAAKLQQGFRFLHDKTVGEFIRHIRLKKAVQLLRTTDMNISEVVYSIGFTSRSYFCKIFKAKYKCNPKQFKQNIMRSVEVRA